MKRRLLASLLFAASACRPNNKPAATTVSGTAVLVAPITSAHVHVTMLTATGPIVVGDGTTDDKGNFEIPLFAAEGTLLVEVLGDEGGNAIAPISGKALQLSYTDRFSNLMAGVKLGTTVSGIIVGPWSTLVCDRALWDMSTNTTAAAQALVTAIQLFSNHFGGIEFLHSLPLDPSAGPTHGLSSEALHGFVTSGLEAMGDDLSKRLGLSEGNLVNAISLTQWLSDDVSADGRFDGVGKNGPIAIVDQSTVNVEFTRALLGAAIGSFVTSSANQSGVGLSDLTGLINAVTSDASVLYGNAPSLSVSEGSGPHIVVSNPAGGSTLKDQVLIVGSATSTAGVAGVTISLDGQQVGSGTRQSVNEIDWAQNVPLTDGFHIAKIVAIDSSGQSSNVTVTFQSDATPPVIAFGYCNSLDDRSRSTPPNVNDSNSQVDWYDPAPPDSNCTADALSSQQQPYAFHSFADLAKIASTSSSLGFVPHDPGPVATADSDLVFTAGVYRGTAQVGQTLRVPASTGDATRAIALSADAFGADLLNVSSQDVLELRLDVVDGQGNTGSQSLYFTLDLLPSPLKVVAVTLNSSSIEHVDHYSFAAGNAAEAFDASIQLPAGIFVAQRYMLTNVSDRSIAFSIPLSSGASLDASYIEWNGFVAGELVEVGTDTTSGTALDQPSLPDLELPPHYSNCYNDESDVHIVRADLADPLSIVSISGGTSNCTDSNSMLTATPIATASADWQVVVQDASGTHRFVSASGDYTIAAGEVLNVSIGFPPPSLGGRTATSCAPSLDHVDYASPLSGIQYSDFLEAKSFSSVSFSLPLGIPATAQSLLQEVGGSGTWSGLGWVDCSGVSCGGVGCRTASDEFILQVQATQSDNQDSESIPETCAYPDGTTYPCLGWQRTVYREYASFALSRLTQPDSFSIDGAASVTTASRLTTNPETFDFTFTLPLEQFTVTYSSKYSSTAPALLQPAVFTKGTLP
jgi:hypothetical protein